MPRPISKRYPFQHTLWKLAAALVIAGIGIIAGLLANRIAGTAASTSSVDWGAYDTLFRMRKPEPRQQGPVALAVIDDASLNAITAGLKYGWPWPRAVYALLIKSAQEAGAKAIVFDMLFEGPSIYDLFEDDSAAFAKAIQESKIPVILGVQATATSRPTDGLAPALRNAPVGAVDVNEGSVLRRYALSQNGVPTLAVAAASAVQPNILDLASQPPFLIYWYGPFGQVDSKSEPPTHLRVSAAKLILSQIAGISTLGGQPISQVKQELARDLNGRIVFVGAISRGLYDQKASPYSPIHPGVDYHATAVENLLSGYKVLFARTPIELAALILPSLIAALATILLHRTILKLAVAILTAAVLLAVVYLLFASNQIVFLTPMPPLVALVTATLLGMSWSYITEGRQRQFLSRAFSQYVSPAVVGELERNPESLSLGGQRRTVTILFSDIRSFTTITEKLDADQIEKFMNTYLGAMTDVVLASGGTVDKYIGDAVMAFWNAPLPQQDHVVLAVKTALAMNAKEREIQPQLQALAKEEIYTRIGLATGEVMVGNFGSAGKINFTALGDSVNLASRLEGANKIYGSQILLAEPTALAAGSAVVVRKLGLLRVKGKTQAMAVYEAMGTLPGTPEMVERKSLYEAAFGAYLIRDWPQAVRGLDELLAKYPGDEPARTFRELVEEISRQRLPDDWDGVYTAHEK